MNDPLIPRLPLLGGMLGFGGMNIPAAPTTEAEEFVRTMKGSGVKTITDDASAEDSKE